MTKMAVQNIMTLQIFQKKEIFLSLFELLRTKKMGLKTNNSSTKQ